MNKKGDNLYDIEDKEHLINDTQNTKKFGDRAMDIVAEIARRNYEQWKKEYIQANMDMTTDMIDLLNDYTNYFKSRA